jgi:serine/threonine-protein kinase
VKIFSAEFLKVCSLQLITGLDMIGKTISHYKILEKLGEGGMGVVYKAHDTKLKREVALKFLPAHAIASEDEKHRFIQEAQAAASLSHANIATVFGIDEHDGDMFIAMEYIEGQTLKDKINEGPLKLKDVVRIAEQIARGLAAAHEKGIVHRDIKSANVMLTGKDQVKIMDFGLAKVTAGSLVTKVGTTLGTISYMSPEQARGETVDNRTDVFSLGVILYEMITGQLPFKGEYESAIIYAILNTDPEPLTAVRTGVPIALERIVLKAMAKDPAERYQHVDELPVDLKRIDLTSGRPPRISETMAKGKIPQKSASWKQLFPWGVAALMTIVVFFFGLKLQRRKPLAVTRCNINLSVSAPLAPIGSAPYGIGRPALIISPDGTNLVYVTNSDGMNQLYLRPMDQPEAVPIPGTEGAYDPFFSPDGQWIGFFAGNQIKKVAIGGGTPISLCEAPNAFGAAWGHDGRIVFTQDQADRLSNVSENGGKPVDLVESGRYNWPHILPGNKAVLASSGSGIKAISLDTGEERVLIEGGTNPRFLSTGHLIYSRGDRMMAVPFDHKKVAVTGTPVPLAEPVRIEASRGAAQCAISNNGTLVYLPGGAQNRKSLLWLDRNGDVEPLPLPAEVYGTFRLSPDGRRLAIEIFREEIGNIWIYDLISGSHKQLTSQGSNRYPVWTPDSRHVIFRSDRDGKNTLFMKSVIGSGELTQLFSSTESVGPYSCSPDGRFLAMYLGQDIFVLPLNGEGKAEQLTRSAIDLWAPAFSPDGRWIAYGAQEQAETIYVEPYPPTGERWKVSTDWGEEPIWSPNFNELFYRNGRKWMVVKYTTVPNFSPERPKVLFEGDYLNVGGLSYDVSPDGRRFLLLKSSEEQAVHTQLNVVFNWSEELKRRVPGDQ